MTTQNFLKVKETEKAILFIVGFKFNENKPTISYTVNCTEKKSTGYLVECWFPKSVIDENGNVADWFCKNVWNAFGRFNGLMDEIFHA